MVDGISGKVSRVGAWGYKFQDSSSLSNVTGPVPPDWPEFEIQRGNPPSPGPGSDKKQCVFCID